GYAVSGGGTGGRLSRPVAGKNSASAPAVESLDHDDGWMAGARRRTISPEGGQGNRRFASEKRLIEPPRDLGAQVRGLGRRVRRARARNRNVGEDPRRTDREQQQTVGEPDGLFDVVRHQ